MGTQCSIRGKNVIWAQTTITMACVRKTAHGKSAETVSSGPLKAAMMPTTWTEMGVQPSAVWRPAATGAVDPGEECDDQNIDNNDSCLDTCRLAYCGDGYTFTGHEECDDSNSYNSDGCTDNCMNAICGDGHVYQGVEMCDDGNESNTDGCTSECLIQACGDGYKWDGVEPCDDGNLEDGDGCSSECKLECNLVFVSSQAFDGKLEGTAGADSKCQEMAEAASLPGVFYAWIADISSSPQTRFKKSVNQYCTVTGQQVAENWDSLVGGQLDHPINITELGIPIQQNSYAWTGTTASGHLDSGKTCNGWVSSPGTTTPAGSASSKRPIPSGRALAQPTATTSGGYIVSVSRRTTSRA